ncbi:amidohydrolase family protein [Bacillus sp. JJ1533]|uniref:amidohydrolase family protein n=1 Tax=Bacillus sp. JJ1533 TaxID=3122959 RepID=UPI002FFF3854
MAYYPGLDKDPRTKVLYTPFQYNSFKSAYDRSFPGYSQEIAEDVTILKNIIDAGGIVVAGTDSPLTHIAFSLHSELAAMAKYGMSNYEALRTATYYPALKLGVADDLGTIEKGKLADLVFVEGNPLEDITDTANVKLVMKNGKAYTIDEIIAPYADK